LGGSLGGSFRGVNCTKTNDSKTNDLGWSLGGHSGVLTTPQKRCWGSVGGMGRGARCTPGGVWEMWVWAGVRMGVWAGVHTGVCMGGCSVPSCAHFSPRVFCVIKIQSPRSRISCAYLFRRVWFRTTRSEMRIRGHILKSGPWPCTPPNAPPNTPPNTPLAQNTPNTPPNTPPGVV
jgi:hypothetical protein